MGFIVSLIVAIIIGWIGSLFVKAVCPGNHRVNDRRSDRRMDRARTARHMGSSPCRLCHHSGNHRAAIVVFLFSLIARSRG